MKEDADQFIRQLDELPEEDRRYLLAATRWALWVMPVIEFIGVAGRGIGRGLATIPTATNNVVRWLDKQWWYHIYMFVFTTLGAWKALELMGWL